MQFRIRLAAIVLLILGLLVGYFIYTSEYKPGGWSSKFPFRLGLDLSGGTHLEYKADTSSLAPADINSSMDALRDVIEKRVNLFGVSEPLVQVESGGVGSQIDHKLIVELPGVTDVNQAIAAIGKTPLLEFRLVEEVAPTKENKATTTQTVLISTGITGRLLQHAQLDFDQTTGAPLVSLAFNSDGTTLFDKVTKENIGKVLGIFLDNQPISLPVIREEIKDGKAQISGKFTAQEAQTLVRNLNYGALPVPIELISTQTVGASLGQDATAKDVTAGLISFVLIAVFLIIWYRLPGLLAVVALAIYSVIMLTLFKLIPVTLTAAGIAGFILSIGMAVDANILIFERMKEEFRRGQANLDRMVGNKGGKPVLERSVNVDGAIRDGFSRAWTSIRDSNFSSIITAIILYWFSNTSIVKGFALILGIGVLVSMFTAITVTRTFLLALSHKKHEGVMKFLFSTGLSTK